MKTQATLQAAIAAHQSGRLAEAEVAYRRILRKQPKNADALHFLGLLQFHRGHPAQALELIEQSLGQAPGNPHAWNNLGNIFVTQDRAPEAERAYRHVTRLAPQMVEPWYNLGVCLRDAGEFQEAALHFRKAIECEPRFFRAYETLGMLCYRLGLNDQAAEIYGAWAQRDPSNSKARHMAAATSGQNVPTRAADDYVQTLFDKFASIFDNNLKQLGYRAPEIVAAALAEHATTSAEKLDVLDAGCGTGLCGPLVRAHCRKLVGVDLSGKMINRARERGGYDELAVAELTAFMRGRTLAFDAIISADTLVYFGALEEVLDAASHALRPAGILIATVEALPHDSADAYRLEAHGRYTHSEPYLRQALTNAGFTAVRVESETLRHERLQDVKGYVLFAQRVA